MEDLLIASRLSGEENVSLEEINLSSSLADLLSELDMGQHHVEIKVSPSLSASADEPSFRTIVRHLLSNARKFTPSHSTIWLEAGRSKTGVDVVVRDEGSGIPKADREKVFERFVQLEGGLTRQVGGVGLGLYLSSRLADQMGAKLVLDDTGPPGASFRLRLQGGPKPPSAR